jgi:PAS domain S-box-containing protein
MRNHCNTEAFFRQLLKEMPGIAWATDCELRCIAVYGAPLIAIGLAPEQVIGRALAEIVGIEGPEGAFVAAHRRALQGQSVRFEKHWGQSVFQGTINPFHDSQGRIIGCVGIAQDITERKRAEEALRASERRFRNYFDQGLIGMTVTSLEKQWVEVNDRLCQMLGYSREELQQRTWEEMTYPDDLELNMRVFNRLLKGEIDHFSMEKRYLRKDGSLLYTTVAVRGFRRDDGTIDHIVTLIEDITARKMAEQALQQEQQNLRHMLDLYDRDRKLTAYEIHDGLAQHLVGASMQFQAFQQARDKAAAAKAFESGMSLLAQSIAEIRRLIADLRPPILDERGVIAAIEHLVHDEPAGSDMVVSFVHEVRFNRLAPPLENALFRIVQESLTNARRHSRSDRLRIELTQAEGFVRVEVRDWGVGFDPAQVPAGRFGLSGVRERARLLGGTAEIQSAPNQGTQIRVALPLVEGQDPELPFRSERGPG